jgi:hypothetical protein
MKANLRENFVFQNDNANMSIGALNHGQKEMHIYFLIKVH